MYIYIYIEGSMEVYREGHIRIYRYILKRVQGLGVHGCGGALGREAPLAPGRVLALLVSPRVLHRRLSKSNIS